MKFYDFVDGNPPIGKLVIIEGTEEFFAKRTLALIVERSMPAAERDLNIDRFVATELESFTTVDAAIAALPFLGTMRLVIVRGVHDLKTEPRRALAKVAERVPDGNILVLEDLVAATSKRPEPIAKLLKGAMRIDTTASEAVRTRFIQEKAAELGVRLDPGALRALGAREVDLASIGTDLEKLALLGQKISLEDVVRETLASTDVKAYQYAAAAVAGRMHEAFGLVTEMFQSDRSAAVPLLAALASEYMLVWEAARPGGDVPAKARWRAGEIKANARALGERKARLGFERAVRGFEAVVTGRADDPRIIVDIATAAAAR